MMNSIWRADGKIARLPYGLCGLLLFGIKYNLDRAVTAWLFGRSWSPLDYVLAGQLFDLTASADATFCAAMVTLGLPFAVAGVVLTVRRLRDAGLPLWVSVLFFMPLVNVLLFLILCVLPSREPEEPAANPQRNWLDRLMPHSAVGSAALAALLTVVFGVGAVAVATHVLARYGWALFVMAPFSVGLVAVLVAGYRRVWHWVVCAGIAALAVTLLGGALLMLAIEGVVCLIMAAPLAYPLALLGGTVGYWILRSGDVRRRAPPVIQTMAVALPLVMVGEHWLQPSASLLEVRSAVIIQAPPERVWENVIAFSELPAPREWLFKIGVAYPLRAELQGRGVGAVRHCVFSTGPFVEPIEVWDEPRLLRFGVTHNPPPLEEWTPYARIHPPHLDGFLVSERGQFLLAPLADGRTRLEGTTWYRHHMWPERYWQWWSDYIIHRIHLRVLKHIQTESETAVAGGRSSSRRPQTGVNASNCMIPSTTRYHRAAGGGR